MPCALRSHLIGKKPLIFLVNEWAHDGFLAVRTKARAGEEGRLTHLPPNLLFRLFPDLRGGSSVG
ncbi:MAG: hypothetical protein RL598_1171 [Verrucomicrobiota bacterium]|jgi:hypothetical protein